MSREEVLAAIPHRPPFLWVDAIVERDPDAGRIVTVKRVDPDEPCFRGHYPGYPITPGVLVLEAIFQTGAILLAERARAGLDAGLVPVLTRIKETRFKARVRPGDELRIEVVLEDALPRLFHLRGRAETGGRLAATTSFACGLAPREP